MEIDKLKESIVKELDLEQTAIDGTTVNIGEVELGNTQKLVFSTSFFRKKKYFDIRTWYLDETGEWKPTKKGVHFSFEQAEEFNKLCQSFAKIKELDIEE